MGQPVVSVLLAVATAAAVCCQSGSCLFSIYKGGEEGSSPVHSLLSDHAFFVRRNRIVPAMLVQFGEQADPASLRSGAATARAVLLPENESVLARFAEAAGTADSAARRRLFIGVIVAHSTKPFNAKRFLRILELLGTNYLDLVIVAGRPCGHSLRDRLACGGNHATVAFLRNWRNLVKLARKRRVLNLGLRYYPMATVAQLHRISTPECLNFPNRSDCVLRPPPSAGDEKKVQKKQQKKKKTTSDSEDKKEQQETGKNNSKKAKSKGKRQKSRQKSYKPVDMQAAYSMRRAAGNVNFLTVVQAAFNPRHRHRSLRHWCHRHSVVLLADEALGGPHSDEMLADPRLISAAGADRLPVRAAVLHWALKKRAAVAVSQEEAAEFARHAAALQLGKSQGHVAAIDGTVAGDMETAYFRAPRRSGSHTRMMHSEL